MSGSLKVTDDISDRLLRLPIYHAITDAQVDEVIEAVKKFYTMQVTAMGMTVRKTEPCSPKKVSGCEVQRQSMEPSSTGWVR